MLLIRLLRESRNKLKNISIFVSKNKFILSSQGLIISALVFCCAGLIIPAEAKAASLYLRSSSNKLTVGSLATVNVFVDTQGKTINNAEANIQFSNDLLEVVSVSYRSSIFSLWVEAPSYSNGNGRISFNGGVPDPGYTGSGGTVMSIIVKAKKAGTASLIFSGAAVRENDGLGTDILSGQSSASIVIFASAVEPKPADDKTGEQTKPDTPTAQPSTAQSQPVLSSKSFPDSNIFYALKEGVISWRLPANASAVQTLLDRNPNSVPTVKYSQPIYQKNISDLDDGVWYFHVRFFADNAWSRTATYKFQIDNTAPSSLFVNAEKTNNCIVGIKLKAEDATSGIDYFDVVIDNAPAIKVSAQDAQNLIPWSQPKSGEHKILVTVFDKAGNKKELITTVKVEELNPPILNALPGKVQVGEKLLISGSSEYPNSNLKLVINFDSGEELVYDVITDKDGNFVYTSEAIKQEGSYKVSAYFIGCGGVGGSVASKSDGAVEQVKIIKNAPKTAMAPTAQLYILGLIIELIFIVVLLLGWYKYIKLKGRMERIKKQNDNLTLSLLLEKANKDLGILTKAQKKKKLNRTEEKAINSLKEIIDDIEMMKR